MFTDRDIQQQRGSYQQECTEMCELGWRLLETGPLFVHSELAKGNKRKENVLLYRRKTDLFSPDKRQVSVCFKNVTTSRVTDQTHTHTAWTVSRLCV